MKQEQKKWLAITTGITGVSIAVAVLTGPPLLALGPIAFGLSGLYKVATYEDKETED
jgi:hypothetical protein